MALYFKYGKYQKTTKATKLQIVSNILKFKIQNKKIFILKLSGMLKDKNVKIIN